MKKLLVVLALLSGIASAGITTTLKPGQWALRKQVGTTITDISRHATLDECVKATPAAGDFRCDTSVAIKAADDCVGVKAPTIVLVKNSEGQWEEPELIVEEISGKWTARQNLYVLAPAGAATCWVRGLTDPDLWRLNGTTAPYLELIVPGMPPVAEADNEQTPVDWPEWLVALHENDISIAIRALP